MEGPKESPPSPWQGMILNSDCQIEAGNYIYRAEKTVLKSQSRFFKLLFEAQHNASCDRLRIDTIDGETMGKMIALCYSPNNPELKCDSLDDLYALMFLRMDNCATRCLNSLSNDINPSTYIEILELIEACSWDIRALTKTAFINYCKENLDLVLGYEESYDFSASVLTDLISCMRGESSQSMYDSLHTTIVRWIAAEYRQRKSEYKNRVDSLNRKLVASSPDEPYHFLKDGSDYDSEFWNDVTAQKLAFGQSTVKSRGKYRWIRRFAVCDCTNKLC